VMARVEPVVAKLTEGAEGSHFNHESVSYRSISNDLALS